MLLGTSMVGHLKKLTMAVLYVIIIFIFSTYHLKFVVVAVLLTDTHMHTHNHFTALWILSGTTQVSRYQKKHSPIHTCCGHQSALICFLHLLQSMASSLFSLRA